MSTDDIPIIDLSPLLLAGTAASPNKEIVSPAERAVAHQLDIAARNFGFFYLVGCLGSASPDAEKCSWIDVEGMLDQGRRLFALDTETKQGMRALTGEGPGWEPPGAQNLDEGRLGDLLGLGEGVDGVADAAAAASVGDLKESYIVSNVTGKGGVLQARWPPAAVPDKSSMIGFQERIEAYHAHCCKLSAAVLRGFAIALGCRPTTFDSDIADPFTKLRLLKYPAKNAARYSPEQSPGCGSHTDWGLLTLLVQDDVGGLEVCLPSRATAPSDSREPTSAAEMDPVWVHVPPKNGAILANVGDMLLRWTNGRYRSAPHRVLQPLRDDADRYSIAFFVNGNTDAMIDPAHLLPTEPPKWSPITSMDYILERVAATYSGN